LLKLFLKRFIFHVFFNLMLFIIPENQKAVISYNISSKAISIHQLHDVRTLPVNSLMKRIQQVLRFLFHVAVVGLVSNKREPCHILIHRKQHMVYSLVILVLLPLLRLALKHMHHITTDIANAQMVHIIHGFHGSHGILKVFESLLFSATINP